MMANTTEPWFVVGRSEALAGLLLTARPEVRVRRKWEHESGVDFLVEIDTDAPPPARCFVARVRGTMSPIPSSWKFGDNQDDRKVDDPNLLPVCLVVVNVRDNTAAYTWETEPRIEARGATLQSHDEGDLHPLDLTSLGDLIGLVKAWYDELPKQLAPV
jgi:hypothetical protein